MKCPKCGSEHVVPIIYGVTEFSEDLKRQIINKEVCPGRMKSGIDQPEYHCFDCGKDVGTPPVLISKRGREDYCDIVTSVRYYERALRDPDELVITVSKKHGVIKLQVEPRFDEGFPVQREMSETEWSELIRALYVKAHLHEWKRVYVEPGIMYCDGYDRSLTIRLTDGRVRKYDFDNFDPPYLPELEKAFHPFMKEAMDAYNTNWNNR